MDRNVVARYSVGCIEYLTGGLEVFFIYERISLSLSLSLARIISDDFDSIPPPSPKKNVIQRLESIQYIYIFRTEKRRKVVVAFQHRVRVISRKDIYAKNIHVVIRVCVKRKEKRRKEGRRGGSRS